MINPFTPFSLTSSRVALLCGSLFLLVLVACAPPPAVQTRAAESVESVRETNPVTATTTTTTTLPLVTIRDTESSDDSDTAASEEETMPSATSATSEEYAVDVSVPDDAVRVQFDIGEAYKIIPGTLEEGEVDTFILRAAGGEPLLIDVVSDNENLQMSLFGLSDGVPLVHEEADLTRWVGTLHAAQEYILHVSEEGFTVEPVSGEADKATRVGKVALQKGTSYEVHVSQPQRLNFAPGQNTAVVGGNLNVGQVMPYIVTVNEGQWLQATVNSPTETAVLSVQGMTDGYPYQDGLATGNTYWYGQATMTQDYVLRVIPSSGATEFTLTVSVSNQPPSGQPPLPNPSPPPAGAPVYINIAPGNTATNLPGQIASSGTATYAMRGVAGQTAAVSLSSATNSVFLTIYGASDGLPLAQAANGVQSWVGVFPTTQDYIITAVNSGPATSFTMSVIVPQRITFAPGATGAVTTGALGPTGYIHYILRASAGQMMNLDLRSDNGNVAFKLVGVTDGLVLADDVTSWQGTLPHTQDYAIKLTNLGNNPSNYTLTTSVQ